eukprot:COSAG02_NODE_8893_length_2406_cov_1.256610_2_plen_297_part_00
MKPYRRLQARSAGDAARRGLRTFRVRRPPPPQEFSWTTVDTSKQLTLRLSEAAGAAPGFGHKIWPSAHTLIAHLAARDDLAGKRVVELGCGVGLVGVAVAALGARTVLTDRDAHVLSQAAANIDLNQTALDKTGGSAVTFRLDWRDDAALQQLTHLHGPFDMIVASDVLYSASMFPSLLQTIDTLSTVAPQLTTTTLLAYPDRDNRSHAKGGEYFTAMATGQRADKAALSWNGRHFMVDEVNPIGQSIDFGKADAGHAHQSDSIGPPGTCVTDGSQQEHLVHMLRLQPRPALHCRV